MFLLCQDLLLFEKCILPSLPIPALVVICAIPRVRPLHRRRWYSLSKKRLHVRQFGGVQTKKRQFKDKHCSPKAGSPRNTAGEAPPAGLSGDYLRYRGVPIRPRPCWRRICPLISERFANDSRYSNTGDARAHYLVSPSVT